MDADIETLSLNNNPPSDEIEEKIRKLLLKDSSYLDDLDTEIVNLDADIAHLVSVIANSRNRLEHLRTTRTATQRKINQYQSILSPLRRLSPELLGEIFYRCLPTHHNPIIMPTECPLLLTHICSFWRAVAISEQRLWSRLHITFSNEDMPDCLDRAASVDIQPSESEQNAIRILRRKFDAIKEWISCCGTRPLSISISFTISFAYLFHDIQNPRRHIALEFFAYIAQLSPRLEDLELKMHHVVYRMLEQQMIDVPAMAKLTSLRAELETGLYLGNLDPLTFLKAPNLKSVSMSTTNSSLWGIRDPSHLASVWRGMTDISFHQCALTPLKLILLLEHAPNLVHFKATISTKYREGSESLGLGYISLPFLRTFSLTDEVGLDPARNLGLYNRIDAPGLTWVQYSGTLRPGEVVANQSENSIFGFLQRLPELKKLTLDSEDPWVGTGRIFRAVPSITHLFIGHEERTLSGSPTSSPRSNSTRRDASRMFKIDELVDDSNDHPNDGLPLLPNLISFEMSSRSSSVNADDLIRFVTSRMNPSQALPSPSSTHSSNARVAQLKHVRVVFYRPRGRDIAKEMQKYAQRVGTDMIDLFFAYPDSPMVNTASSERSWKYQDAEEFTIT